MKTPKISEVEWTAGRCSHHDCSMTMVMYIGADQWICWLHALTLGIFR